MKPLTGVRVIDLTQILSGPFATQILADLGAEVIKIEPLWGDKARQNGPEKVGRSTYFASLNRGKKSVAVDLKNPRGREIVSGLASAADVLVENFRPGVMDRLGLGYSTLRNQHPRLIYAACSGFGRGNGYSGRPALDIVIQAMAGTMSVTGTSDGEPVKVGFSVGDVGAGLYLALGIMAALQGRHVTGQGCLVDISMLESQAALLENAFARYFATAEVPGPLGSRHAVMAPFQAFRTLDGYLVVAVSTQAHWQKLCHVLDLPELAADQNLATSEGRVMNRTQWEPVLNVRFREQPTQVWLERLSQANIPAGPINTVAQASREPALAERDLFIDVNYAGVPFRVVGTPMIFDQARPVADGQVPDLGEHTKEVLRAVLNLGPEDIAALYEVGAIR
ncbi:MAG: CoA transferase [Thermaerobacter sp.]|nr:CoA transferase [Thermaerobacter sp.]